MGISGKRYRRKSENELFAHMLDQRLTERKVKPRELAEALGVDVGTVYRWIRAETTPDKRDTVFSIVDFLRFTGELRKRFLLAYFNEKPQETVATETTRLVLVEPPSIEIQAPSLGRVSAHELHIDGQQKDDVTIVPNELVRLSMFVRNEELGAIRVLKLVAAVRGPHASERGWDADVGDFGTVESIRLDPDEQYEYTQENIFYKPGDYFIVPLFLKPDGSWETVRPRRRLHFVVKSR